MRNPSALAKYLARYAEPEASRVPSLPGPFYAALVVPAFAEAETLLDGYRNAARAARGRVLVVLVVNAPEGAAPEQLAANTALLKRLRPTAGEAPEFVVEQDDFTLLVVDRSSPGREIPSKQGVGLARKIGADIALCVAVRDGLELPFVFATDADVNLPSDYFLRAEAAAEASALLYPFEHARGDAEAAVFEATSLYELSLRYHVLGLGAAGSPYAYHSIGSTFAVHLDSYAQVRGYPKRAAGEDFYLLDKLGKVLALAKLSGEPLQIRARRSLRVPFGTGPRVERLLSEPSASVDHPECYRALGALTTALDAFARERDVRLLSQAFSSLPGELARAAALAADASGVVEAASAALSQVGGADLRRRMHTWFDGLRSLRFLHAVGDHGFAELPCREALERAPFTATPSAVPLPDALVEARRLEALLAPRSGPAALRID